MKETPAVIDYLQPCTTMGLSWCAGQRVGVSHVLFRSWFFGQRFECSKLRRCRLKSTCGGWRLHDRGIWPCGHQGHGWRLQAIGDRPDHKFEFRSSRAYQPEDRRLRNSRKTQPGGADGRRRARRSPDASSPPQEMPPGEASRASHKSHRGCVPDCAEQWRIVRAMRGIERGGKRAGEQPRRRACQTGPQGRAAP